MVKSANRVRLCLLVLLLFAVLAGNAEGQETNLLLFARNPAFLPEIEGLLGDLRDAGTGDRLFASITNVNKWFINRLEEGDLNGLMQYYESGRSLRRRDSASFRRSEAFTQFVYGATSYIRIDVMERLPLVEFQFIITDSLPATTTSDYPVLITEQSRLEGFVIDISRPDFHDQLARGVRRLFPACDQTPIVVVDANCKQDDSGYYYVGVGRTLEIDVSRSYDPDEVSYGLSYKWEQINPVTPSLPLSVKDRLILPVAHPVLETVLPDTGKYWVNLSVSDGISRPVERLVRIRVVQRPQILTATLIEARSATRIFSSDSVEFGVTLYSPRPLQSELRVGFARKRKHRAWHDLFVSTGEFDYVTVDSSNIDILPDSTNSDSTGRSIQYRVRLRNAGGSGRWQYEVPLIAGNPYGIDDTVVVRVEYTGASAGFAYDVQSVRYTGIPGASGDTVSYRAVYVGFRDTWPLGKGFGITWGFSVRVHQGSHIDTDVDLGIPLYISLETPRLALVVREAGGYVGVGLGCDIGSALPEFPLSLEYVYYPRGFSSSGVAIRFDAPGDVHGLLMLALILVPAAIT